jgi:predicted kinase
MVRKRLFVMIGKPGHGKSYVAHLISDMTGAVHLETDKIRKNRVVEDSKEPQYTTEESKKTYDTTLELADENFNNKGYSVVLDGTFNIRDGRKRAKEISGDQTEFVKVSCPENRAKKRMEQRNDDTDAEIYDKFHMESIKYDHTVIDNSGSKSETKSQIKNKLL